MIRRPALMLLLVWALAGTSAAADDASCPHWFPDLHCERQARYAGFVAPMSMPYLFEEPFIQSGVQLVQLWQEFPQRSIFEGGHLDLSALQIRLAVTEHLAIIAVRDGYAWFKPDLAIVSHDRGFADISIGVKYALIDRPDAGFILTPALRFEPDLGKHDLFQGFGDGIVMPSVSMGWAPSSRVHVLANLGAQLPFDGGANSTYVFYNLHADYQLTSRLSPFVEVSGISWTSDGDGQTKVHLAGPAGARLSLSAAQAALATGRFEGFDFANLGSEGVDGNDMITAAVGIRYQWSARLSLGLSYERPVTERKDIFKQRAMFVATYDF